MEILAVIPARGGSKGVPRKNLRTIGGKSLIAHTVQAAKSCRYPMRVVMTTDDEEIAEEAARWGAEVPFLRPAHLGQDTTPTLPVIQHLLTELESREGYVPDFLVLLQVTTPLRRAEAIDAGLELLLHSDADSVVGVCRNEHPIHWTKTVGPDGFLRDFLSDAHLYSRRQDAPTSYRVNGALYITRPDIIRLQNRLLGDKVLPLVMDEVQSVDIDCEMDLVIAEALFQHYFTGLDQD